MAEVSHEGGALGAQPTTVHNNKIEAQRSSPRKGTLDDDSMDMTVIEWKPEIGSIVEVYNKGTRQWEPYVVDGLQDWDEYTEGATGKWMLPLDVCFHNAAPRYATN